MSTILSPSIIMRIREFGETDLLVSFFTSRNGRLKGIAKGARKSRKRFPNCLDLFSLVNMEYQLRNTGDLHFLHSCRLLDGFQGIRSEFTFLSLASYMIEITELLFPTGVSDPGMFELLRESFSSLDKGKGGHALRAFFEARSMALGGFTIILDKCCTCGRSYHGEGRAVFIIDRGCIACLKCASESGSRPGMGPDAVRGLGVMQSGSVSQLEELLLTEESLREIKTIIKMHMEYRLSRRIKTLEYIE